MSEPLTDVIFRIGRSEIEMMNYRNDQAVIALFPGVPGTNDPYTCSSFVHVGQHGSADPQHVIRTTRPAKAAEYAELKHELESAPYSYRLRLRSRLSHRYLEQRRRELA